MRKSGKHYHVTAGLAGCMPDVNYFCRSRRGAEGDAAELAGQAREGIMDVREDWKARGWDLDSLKPMWVEGSARAGGYEINVPGFWDYIEIAECYEPECWDYEEEDI